MTKAHPENFHIKTVCRLRSQSSSSSCFLSVNRRSSSKGVSSKKRSPFWCHHHYCKVRHQTIISFLIQMSLLNCPIRDIFKDIPFTCNPDPSEQTRKRATMTMFSNKRLKWRCVMLFHYDNWRMEKLSYLRIWIEMTDGI